MKQYLAKKHLRKVAYVLNQCFLEAILNLLIIHRIIKLYKGWVQIFFRVYIPKNQKVRK